MGTDAISQANRVGRLIETRVCGEMSLADVPKLRDGLYAILERRTGTFISAIDIRKSMTRGRDQIASQLLQLFKDTNDRIERTGILMGADPLMPVQVESIIVQARHTGRRAFREVEAMIAFLGEVATPEETARLREFFAEN
jgi:hypothetical protein